MRFADPRRSPILLTLFLGVVGGTWGQAVCVDLLSLGVGATIGAVHLRGSYEWPSKTPVSMVTELGLYYAGFGGDPSFQVDAVGLARWRPWGQGPFLGTGAGLVFSHTYGQSRVKAAVLGEAGWAMELEGSGFSLEPFVRENAAFDLKSASFIPSIGLRLGLSLPNQGAAP